jgi:hypothetical protein
MKHFSIFLLIVLSAFSSLKGQQYSIGLKPSLLIIGAKRTQEPYLFENNYTTLGGSYAIGISLSDQINKRFGLKIEPRLIVQGYNMKYTGYPDKFKYRNKYLSIPFIFSYSPKQKLNLEFGPEFCILLIPLEKTPEMKSFSRRFDSRDLRKFEFSLVSGISYPFLERIDLGARFGFGLSALEKVTKTGFWSGPDINIKTVQYYFEFYLNTRLFTKIKNN